jgi:pimeloyl-ACP methyl ester carboxylesterase
LAAIYALKYPERVTKLILASPGLFWFLVVAFNG